MPRSQDQKRPYKEACFAWNDGRCTAPILQVQPCVPLVLKPGQQEAIVPCQTRRARTEEEEGGPSIPAVIALLVES